MSKTITTTTGIKQDVLDKFNLNANSIAAKLKATLLEGTPTKQDLTPGVYVFRTKQGISVYTTELDKWPEGYIALDNKAQVACQKDGYNRQHVNKPAHEAVKAKLGIKEASAKVKAVAEVTTHILSNMVKAGVKAEFIYNTFPDVPKDAIDKAIKANQK